MGIVDYHCEGPNPYPQQAESRHNSNQMVYWVLFCTDVLPDLNTG